MRKLKNGVIFRAGEHTVRLTPCASEGVAIEVNGVTLAIIDLFHLTETDAADKPAERYPQIVLYSGNDADGDPVAYAEWHDDDKLTVYVETPHLLRLTGNAITQETP